MQENALQAAGGEDSAEVERSTRRAYSSGPVRPFFADLLYSTTLHALVFLPHPGKQPSHLAQCPTPRQLSERDRYPSDLSSAASALYPASNKASRKHFIASEGRPAVSEASEDSKLHLRTTLNRDERSSTAGGLPNIGMRAGPEVCVMPFVLSVLKTAVKISSRSHALCGWDGGCQQ